MTPETELDSPRLGVRDFVALILILLLNAIALWFNAFRAFNFFDYGGFLAAGWSVASRSSPFRDFLYIAGPVHLFMHGYFFKTFEFGTTAILAHMIAVSSLPALQIYFATRAFRLPLLAAPLALLTVALFYWPMSHPWYDQSAYLWTFLGALSALKALKDPTVRGAAIAGGLAGFCAGTAIFTKTNIGIFNTVALGAFFAAIPARRIGFTCYLIGLTAVIGIFLAIFPGELLFDQTLGAALTQKSRASRLFDPGYWFGAYGGIFLLVIGAALAARRLSPLHVLGGGLALAAIASYMTGSLAREVFHGAMLPPTVFVTLLAIRGISADTVLHRRMRGALYAGIAAICVSFLLVSSHFAFVRRWEIGSVWLSQGDYAMRNAPLSGWRCDPRNGEALDGMVEFLARNLAPSDSLLVLTHMQILYPLLDRPIFPGTPFLWSAKTLPAPGAPARGVRDRILADPPEWIVRDLHRTLPLGSTDSILEELEMPEDFLERYETLEVFGDYAVLKRSN